VQRHMGRVPRPDRHRALWHAPCEWARQDFERLNMSRLNGKRIIVVGAASGIGKAVAQAAVSEGAQVVIADLNADLGEATAKAIGASFVACDVADEQSVIAMVRTAVDRMGGLDGLVN